MDVAIDTIFAKIDKNYTDLALTSVVRDILPFRYIPHSILVNWQTITQRLQMKEKQQKLM